MWSSVGIVLPKYVAPQLGAVGLCLWECLGSWSSIPRGPQASSSPSETQMWPLGGLGLSKSLSSSDPTFLGFPRQLPPSLWLFWVSVPQQGQPLFMLGFLSQLPCGICLLCGCGSM